MWTPPPNLSSGLSRNAVHSLGLVVSNGCDFLEPIVEMKPEDGASAAREGRMQAPEALAEERTMLPKGWLRPGARGPWSSARLCETWARWQNVSSGVVTCPLPR